MLGSDSVCFATLFVSMSVWNQLVMFADINISDSWKSGRTTLFDSTMEREASLAMRTFVRNGDLDGVLETT